MARLILLSCLAPLLVAAARIEHPRIVSRPMLATALIGMEVRDAHGARAGHLADLVLDLEGKRVRHALVSLDGGLAAVSLFDLRLSLPRQHLSLRPQLEGVRAVRAPADAPRASAWLRRELHAAGAVLGTLVDLVVDVHEGAVAFALLGLHEGLHPLPLDSLAERGGKLRLTFDPARLQSAHSFSARSLADHLENNAFLHSQADYADRLTDGARAQAGMRSASTRVNP